MTVLLRRLYRAARRACGAGDPSDLWWLEWERLRSRGPAVIVLTDKAARQAMRDRMRAGARGESK